MNSLPKTILIVTLTGCLGVALYEARRAVTLEAELRALREANASRAAVREGESVQRKGSRVYSVPKTEDTPASKH